MTGPAPPSPGPAAPGRSLSRQAFSAVAWLSALNGLGGLGMLALAWWLNRTLDDAPVRMGQWSVVLSLTLMVSLVFEGGITAAIQQRQDLDRRALGTMAWLQLGLGVVASASLFFLAQPVAVLMASDADTAELTRLIRLACPAVFAIAAGQAPKALLQRDLKFRHVACVEGGATFLTIAVAIALVPRHGVLGLLGALNARHVAETVAYWALGGQAPWRVLVRPDWTAAREPIRYAMGIAAQSILGTLVRQGDVLLVGALAGTVAAGVYRQIQQLVVQPYSKLTMFVQRAAFPALARLQADRERMQRGVARLQRLLALTVLPMLVGLAAVAPRVLTEYLGEQYAPHLAQAVPAMGLLCLAAAVTSYGSVLIVAVNAIGDSRPVLKVQALGSAAIVLLMVAGAPWALGGVAAGRLAAACLHLALVLRLARVTLGFGVAQMLRSVREAVPAALACAAAAAAGGWLLSRWWPPSDPLALGVEAGPLRLALLAQIALGALVYAAVLLALRLNPRAEWRTLRG